MAKTVNNNEWIRRIWEKLKEVASKQYYSPTIFDKCLEKHPEYKEYLGRYIGIEFNLWCEKTKNFMKSLKKKD